MPWILAFVAGFISTLVFHQAVIGLFYVAGAIPAGPWNFAPVDPLGVPAVISLAFWGGLWGIVLWALIRGIRGGKHWVAASVIGAIGPTAGFLFVAAPLKGFPFAMGWDPKFIVGGLIVNAVWGLGVAVLMKLFAQRAA